MLARRHVLAALLFALGGGPAAAQAPGPRAWVVHRGSGRAFIMGYADAPDETWLTPTIRAAFDAMAIGIVESATVHRTQSRWSRK